MNKTMNFDQLKIARIYDRARTLSPETLESWARILRQFVPPSEVKKILDLGTGTGLFAPFLRGVFRAAVVGIDPSREMLGQAKKMRGPGVHFLRGRAEALPLPRSSFDLVFMSMVYHTFSSRKRALAEIYRVLRPGGYVIVIQAVRETNNQVPAFKFFRESKRLSDELNPSARELGRAFTTHGFRQVTSRFLKYEVAPDYKEYYRLIALRGYSVLRLIPQRTFQTRLKEFARYALNPNRRGSVHQTTGLFIFQKI